MIDGSLTDCIELDAAVSQALRAEDNLVLRLSISDQDANFAGVWTQPYVLLEVVLEDVVQSHSCVTGTNQRVVGRALLQTFLLHFLSSSFLQVIDPNNVSAVNSPVIVLPPLYGRLAMASSRDALFGWAFRCHSVFGSPLY